MFRFFIEIAYFGEAYSGWQTQPGQPSIQETIEKALSLTARQTIEIVGQGRTDAGVHALCSFAHFEIDSLPYPAENWTYKLNSLLPPDIAIKQIIPVNKDAHARFSADGRAYTYIINTQKNPFFHKRAWDIYRPLNIENMEKAAEHLLGKHDFTSFSSTKSEIENRVCHVTKLTIRKEDTFIYVDISANRFVMNMVRTIVGTLVEVGIGKRTESDIDKILAAQDRTKAGENAPAHGLYLKEVKYPEHIFTI